jgi:hypothetical protein
MDFRGRDGQQMLRPGQDRPGGGDRAGDKAGDRAGDRAGADRGDRAKGGSDRPKGGGNRAKAANRGAGGAARGGGNALNVSSGRAAAAASALGQASLGARGGGGGASFAGRGGSGGGGRGGGGGGGGRRSDIALKRDIVLLGHLASGLGYYRFSYLGSDKAYVGVIAQEVQRLMPEAVTRGADGYLRVYYEKLGLKLRTYRDWLASAAKIPMEKIPMEVTP